jgi:hypothetical protein
MRLSEAATLEGYADARFADRIAHRYGLERVGERAANLIIHVVPRAQLPAQRFMPRAVVAADLADHVDERAKSVGEVELTRGRR